MSGQSPNQFSDKNNSDQYSDQYEDAESPLTQEDIMAAGNATFDHLSTIDDTRTILDSLPAIPNLVAPGTEDPNLTYLDLSSSAFFKKIEDNLQKQVGIAKDRDSNTQQYLQNLGKSDVHVLGKIVRPGPTGLPTCTIFYLDQKGKVQHEYVRVGIEKKGGNTRIMVYGGDNLRKIFQTKSKYPQDKNNTANMLALAGIDEAIKALEKPNEKIDFIEAQIADETFHRILKEITNKLDEIQTHQELPTLERDRIQTVSEHLKKIDNSNSPIKDYIKEFQETQKNNPVLHQTLTEMGINKSLLTGLAEQYRKIIQTGLQGTEQTELNAVQTTLHDAANDPQTQVIFGHSTAKFDMKTFASTMAENIQSIATRYQGITTLNDTEKPAFRINAHEEKWYRKANSDITIPLVFNGAPQHPKDPAEIRINVTSSAKTETLKFSVEGKLADGKSIPLTDKMNLVAEAQALSMINHFKNGGTVADIRNLQFSPQADMYARIKFALQVQLKTLQLAGDPAAQRVENQIKALDLGAFIKKDQRPTVETAAQKLLYAMHKDPVNVAFFAQQPKPVEKETVPLPASAHTSKQAKQHQNALEQETPKSEITVTPPRRSP